MAKVKFRDLSWPIKVGAIGGWLVLIVYAISLILGLIGGIFG